MGRSLPGHAYSKARAVDLNVCAVPPHLDLFSLRRMLFRKLKDNSGLFTFGCSLFARFSASTVGLKPSEKTTTCPSFPFRSTCNESSNRNQWIYKMPNKTRQKLYFSTILDLEHQWTPLTTRWVAHFWKHTFTVVLRTCLWMPIDSHSEAALPASEWLATGGLKWAKYPRQEQWSKFLPTTLLHPRQTRKGAESSKYRNRSLTFSKFK